MPRPIDTFKDLEKRGYAVITLDIQTTNSFQYSVGGFQSDQDKRNQRSPTVIGNFSYLCTANVLDPKVFRDVECLVHFNQIGRSYIEYFDRGLVGAGRYSNGRFEFFLYFSSEVTKDILFQVPLLQETTDIGDRRIRHNASLSLCNFFEGGAAPDVSFEVDNFFVAP